MLQLIKTKKYIINENKKKKVENNFRLLTKNVNSLFFVIIFYNKLGFSRF